MHDRSKVVIKNISPKPRRKRIDQPWDASAVPLAQEESSLQAVKVFGTWVSCMRSTVCSQPTKCCVFIYCMYYMCQCGSTLRARLFSFSALRMQYHVHPGGCICIAEGHRSSFGTSMSAALSWVAIHTKGNRRQPAHTTCHSACISFRFLSSSFLRVARCFSHDSTRYFHVVWHFAAPISAYLCHDVRSHLKLLKHSVYATRKHCLHSAEFTGFGKRTYAHVELWLIVLLALCSDVWVELTRSPKGPMPKTLKTSK